MSVIYKLVVDERGNQEVIALSDIEITELQNLPEIALAPDWSRFINAMQPFFPIGLAQNYIVFTQIFNMLLVLRDKRLDADNSNVEYQNFAFNFRLGRSAFNSEQITEIESAMALANIPLIE